MTALATEFEGALASYARSVANAEPGLRKDVFRQVAREPANWSQFGVQRPDIVDRMRDIGLDAGLSETDVQEALAWACAHPFNGRRAEEKSAVAEIAAHLLKPEKPTGDGKAASIAFARVSDVAPAAVRWLWTGRVATGKLTLVAGDPGIGKSQFTIDLTSRITVGDTWPDGGRAPLGSVLMLSAEDAVDDTIRPRLEAAGADLTKVHVLKSVTDGTGRRRTFNLASDLGALASRISQVGDVALVTVDPITSYMGAIDSHRTTDVRTTLEPLAEFAEANRVAVLAISHPPKAAQAKALHAVTGSLAFVAAARIAFIVVEEPEGDGRRLLLPVKNNLAPFPPGLGFRLIQRLVGPKHDIVASHIAWDSDPVTMTANEAVMADGRQAQQEAGPALSEAMTWLSDRLASGDAPAREIEDAAKAAGISERTLRRARKRLEVEVRKGGYRDGWTWALPPKVAK